MTPPKIIYVKKSEIDKARVVIARDYPALVPVLAALINGYTIWEQQFGIDLQQKPDDPAPTPDPVEPPEPEPQPDPEQIHCGCGSEKVDYQGARETILGGDVRCLINWKRPHGDASWLTEDQMDGNLKIEGKTMTVTCPNLGDGITAHYLGYAQPSSESPLVEGNPVEIGHGTLRLVFEARRTP